jgi:hypothetical protein
MAIKLNQAGYDYAIALIRNGLEVEHTNSDWDEVEPTENDIVRYLNSHTLSEYGNWFLAIDTDADQKDASKYLYPFGDLKIVYKSALIAAEKEATRNDYAEIKMAAKQLLELIRTMSSQ